MYFLLFLNNLNAWILMQVQINNIIIINDKQILERVAFEIIATIRNSLM